MIYCLSKHHTGTWVHQHEGVGAMLTTAHLFGVLEGEIGLNYPDVVGEPIVPAWHPTMVYHEHVTSDDLEPLRIERRQVLLATMTPTVIPIRDPLAALISYQERALRDGRIDEPGQPRFDPAEFVDKWIRLAETARAIFVDFAHIKFLCWDLASGMDRMSRYIYLREIAEALGLADDGPSAQCGVKVIRHNDFGQYELKDAYDRRDLTYIRRNVANGGFEALRACRGILRPFLERLGYRDLLWWS